MAVNSLIPSDYVYTCEQQRDDHSRSLNAGGFKIALEQHEAEAQNLRELLGLT